MGLRFAPGAATFGGPPIVVGVALLFLPVAPWIGALVILLGLGVIVFHRDPDRVIGAGVVSPSDGVVAQAATGPAGTFLGVFLNVHDVHVVRAPADAAVVEVRRLEGPRAPAWSRKAGHNAGVELRLATEHGEMRLRMLVGMVARRVIPYVVEGQRLQTGERIGLIRFGSRTELILAPSLRVTVTPGTKVLAGASSIAEVAP